MLLQDSRFNPLRSHIQETLTACQPKNQLPRNKVISSRPTQESAVTTIQRFWRAKKIKDSIVCDPYSSYLSLLDPEDEQSFLSALMFGRHEAELHPGKIGHINNPFIHEKLHYHRGDRLQDNLITCILSTFNLSQESLYKYYYMPVTLLKSAPIEKIIQRYQEKFQCQAPGRLIKNQQNTLGVIEVSREEVQINFRSMQQFRLYLIYSGLPTTPWGIASHIANETDSNIANPFDDAYSPWRKKHELKEQMGEQSINFAFLDSTLPNTQESLLASKMVKQLSKITFQNQHPTQELAAALQKLLQQLPELKSQAIQRIALFLHIANTFYVKNYSRYAFYVYAIVHEISLALAIENNSSDFNQLFSEFWDESEQTLTQILGLNDEALENTSFITSPAIAGTHSHTIALFLAQKMNTESGEEPTIQVFDPDYFEFQTLRSSTTHNDQNTDIFIITTGPIVNDNGLSPGVDINLFIKRHMIEVGRTHPATLLIDASTTLYKNLELNDDAKELVYQGLLSIIIFESHQKFGLLHTDEAQYGRMFALCAKQSFDASILDEIRVNAQEDFNHHLDMRVGAFINTRCGNILEKIKQRHFENGALMRRILATTELKLIEKDIVAHQDMLTNLDELYFINSSRPYLPRATQHMDRRGSFGHFNTTKTEFGMQLRVSADASDKIDCLIETVRIYVEQDFDSTTVRNNVSLFLELKDLPLSLPIEDQILILAFSNKFMRNYLHSHQASSAFLLNLGEIFAIHETIQHIMLCIQDLVGRRGFMQAQEYAFLWHCKLEKNCYERAMLLLEPHALFVERLAEYSNFINYQNKLPRFTQTIIELFEQYIFSQLHRNRGALLKEETFAFFQLFLKSHIHPSKSYHYIQQITDYLLNENKISGDNERESLAILILNAHANVQENQVLWALHVFSHSNSRRNMKEHIRREYHFTLEDFISAQAADNLNQTQIIVTELTEKLHLDFSKYWNGLTPITIPHFDDPAMLETTGQNSFIL